MLTEMKWKDGLLNSLLTDTVNGISEEAAEMEDRKQYFGTNEKPALKTKSLLALILECFEDTMLQVLLLAAAVSLLVGIWKDGIAEGWLEGVTIYVAVVLIVAVTSGNNYIKQKQFQKLMELS